ncbi:MAG: hypothetical protein KAH72_07525 [Flavobacteriaceae bacterium]|nr:hypothetical protein [Flavobacteriaceae bacterium]
MSNFKEFLQESKGSEKEIIKTITRVSKGKNTSKGGDFSFDSLIDAQYDGKELMSGSYIYTDGDSWKIETYDREGNTFIKTADYNGIIKILKDEMMKFTEKKFIQLVKEHQ